VLSKGGEGTGSAAFASKSARLHQQVRTAYHGPVGFSFARVQCSAAVQTWGSC
jgi:hypothetical protein